MLSNSLFHVLMVHLEKIEGRDYLIQVGLPTLWQGKDTLASPELTHELQWDTTLHLLTETLALENNPSVDQHLTLLHSHTVAFGGVTL